LSTIGKLVIAVDADTGAATAKFVDLGDGAERSGKKIQGAFNGIDTSEARGGMMLFDDLVGVKLPRHVTSFISSLGPVAAAMELAFPFLAIAVAASVLIEHLTKLKETAEKLDTDTAKFEVTINSTFTSLDDKLLQAQIKADELNRDHLGALAKQLTLIDHASMKELMQTFDNLSKAVDAVFADMKSHWYNISLGSEGAQHALDDFKKKYDLLLSEGKGKDAGDLLAGTLESAKKAKQELEEIKKFYAADTPKSDKTYAEFEKVEGLKTKYRAQTYQGTMDQIEAQNRLLEVLNATVEADKTHAAIVAQERDNAKQETSNKLGNENFRRMKEEERQQSEEDRRREEVYREAVKRIQDNEKDKIAATKEGSAQRLAAIDAAITEENHKGLQETEYYKELGRQRIELIRHMADEEARVRQEAGKIAAEHDTKMADLNAAAELEQIRHRQAMRRKADQEDIDAAIAVENKEYDIKQKAYQKQIAALDKNDKDYQNKLKALQNKEEELTQQHENKITDIKDKGEEERNKRILAAERKFEDSLAQGLTSVLMRQESFSKMMLDLGDQVVAGMLKNALMSMMTADMTKEKDAAHAARKGYNAGMDFPFPINIVMAPLLGASAFAAVMAFNRGGLVPGSGNSDIIPAMLTPGERVLTVEENRMLSQSNSGSNGMAQNVTYAPVVHVPPGGSAKEFEKFIDGHFDRWTRSQSRKKGIRFSN
jgi:hypothetical protein